MLFPLFTINIHEKDRKCDIFLCSKEKEADIDKLAKQVIAQYKKFELDEDFDISVFTDYEKCKDNISFKLINYEKNKEPAVHTKNYWKKVGKIPRHDATGIETKLWIKNQSNGEYYLRKTNTAFKLKAVML